jgi:REP element-mobilizing transposase RayT
MDRYWLLSSTFYGNWLPGDARGFVGRVWDARPGDSPSIARHIHDMPGIPYDADLPALRRTSQSLMRGEPIRVTVEQAKALIPQFRETAAYRGWRLLAVAVMANHIHIVTGVPGDPDPTKILGDYKAYGSRLLNRRWGKPTSGTWWTYDGSKRKLPDERALRDAIIYVRDQPHALAVWIDPTYPL